MLRESSWLERNLSFSKRYLKPLDKVLPVYRVETHSVVDRATSKHELEQAQLVQNESISISLNEITTNPNGHSNVGEPAVRPHSQYGTELHVKLPQQTLSVKVRQIDSVKVAETELLFKDRYDDQQIRRVKATTSIASLPSMIKVENPIIVLDVDETLIRKVSGEGESEHFEALESNTAKVLIDIQKRYPEAKFILLSQGAKSLDSNYSISCGSSRTLQHQIPQ